MPKHRESSGESGLKSVYKRYEQERQPEVLALASDYLGQMTEGRYRRIWTPLAEDVLRVDDAQNIPLPVEMLSRGTREQVFLSLRLALIENYAHRGIEMPIVLDDVLANFDRQRCLAAAQVICNFTSSGHQIFLFTCHEHLVEMFGKLGAELRSIPKRSGDFIWEGRELENSKSPDHVDAAQPPKEVVGDVEAA